MEVLILMDSQLFETELEDGLPGPSYYVSPRSTEDMLHFERVDLMSCCETFWQQYFVIEINAVNQGLATLAFFGVEVNLVLFLTRVLQQDNAEAANTVSKWTGTVYIFSLLGAFLSDSYWGRYKTCAIFQAIFVIVSVSLSECLGITCS